MSFRTDLLAVIDQIRRIPGEMDLRQNEVTVIVRTWSGARVGVGTKTDVSTVLKIAGDTNPKVSELSQKDIVASGGELTSQDVKIGPFTPDFVGGGIDEDVIDPPTGASPKEVYFKVTGNGMGSGRYFKRYQDETLKNFSRWVFLKATAWQP